METTDCAECGAMAEVLARDTWPSTSGGVEHVKTVCLRGHRLYYPTD